MSWWACCCRCMACCLSCSVCGGLLGGWKAELEVAVCGCEGPFGCCGFGFDGAEDPADWLVGWGNHDPVMRTG